VAGTQVTQEATKIIFRGPHNASHLQTIILNQNAIFISNGGQTTSHLQNRKPEHSCEAQTFDEEPEHSCEAQSVDAGDLHRIPGLLLSLLLALLYII